MYTAAIAKITDYYAFSEEVERIMTNLETTDQFRVSYRCWLRERSKDSGLSMTVTAYSRGPAIVARVDTDRDTVIAPINTNGDCNRNYGNRKNSNGKQRAKWVNPAERERRRNKRLCFRYRGSGHYIRDCPYEPAIKPVSINTVTA
jgi:hypothetical protein